MGIIVGTNSYIDVQEANQLITDNFMSKDPIRVFWESLNSNSDKESLIISSTKKYDRDSMCYKWFKQDVNQSLQFPRVDIYKNVIDCPEDIKLGLLIQGIKTNMMNKYAEYQELKAQGVKSFGDGSGAKIEWFDTFQIKDMDTTKLSNGMFSGVYNQYFKDYIDIV